MKRWSVLESGTFAPPDLKRAAASKMYCRFRMGPLRRSTFLPLYPSLSRSIQSTVAHDTGKSDRAEQQNTISARTTIVE